MRKIVLTLSTIFVVAISLGIALADPGDSCDSGKVLDCDLNCVSSETAQSYIGDGYCDDGTWGYVLTCPEFDNDGGDCGGNPGDSCGAGKVLDCALNCVDSSTAQSYIGDGYCDDGTYEYVLTCPEFNNDGGDCGGGGLWQQNGSDIYYNDGYVGIGKTDPASQLDVSSTNSDAITGKTSDGFGVVGISTGSSSSQYAGGIGGYFESTNAFGQALHAVNTNTTTGIGVYGKAAPLLGWAGLFDGRVSISYRLGINTVDPVFTLDVNGTTRTNALVIGNGSDIAEPFKVGDSINIKPGMVVSIDSEQPGQVRIADSAYDRTVAGIVSGANGLNTGLTMSQEGTVTDGTLPVALTGRVYAWADASKGPIKPGDLLTTSDTPGHAMKVSDYEKGHGAVLGKSMTALKQGKGLVLVLISLQ